MNIAYKGSFLREGLLLGGHYVHDIDTSDGKNLANALKASPVPIDLVIWEFFGAHSDIWALTPVDAPLVAYCVDTPLNEFWLKPAVKYFDRVFVDQPQNVSSFAEAGIATAWSPLPAQNSYFRSPCEKEWDATFIGVTNELRTKRNNLLNLLQSKFKLNRLAGLDLGATQDVFAKSKIVLNENFFPGLTLRVQQGLSAGSIVYTESSPYDDTFGLEDNKHLVFYDPTNAPERLADLLANYDKYKEIAIEGQKRCRELFSSEKVAASLVARATKGAGLAKRDEADYHWNRVLSELLFAQRFGGDFSGQARELKKIAASDSEKTVAARLLLGDIQARFKSPRAARESYKSALEMDAGSLANLRLAVLDILDNDPNSALKWLITYSRRATTRLDTTNFLSPGRDPSTGILTAIAEIYFSLGKRWDMGFRKYYANPAPDTAFDVALMAWKRGSAPAALAVMLKCLRPYGLRGELLPYMLEGVKKGALSSAQILEAAEIAFEYYDRETAANILSIARKKA